MCRQGGQDVRAHLFKKIQTLEVGCSGVSEKEHPGILKHVQSLHHRKGKQRRGLLTVDPIGAQLVVEAGTADLEETRSLDPIAPGFLECFEDTGPLRLLRGAARNGS